jgi:hypothetical protein
VKSPTPWIAILLAGLASQNAGGLPSVRHPTCLRFYTFEGDVKPEVLRKAVSDLGTKEAEARITIGPSKVSSRPRARFLVLEVPSRTPGKEVEAALKKVCPHADELAWTAFQGQNRSLPPILGYSALDCVVGMDNDVRWFDLSGGLARFYYTPGKFDAKSLRVRFGKLYQPFNAGELGELVHDTIEWRLAEPVDASAAKSAEKAIAKIPGVRKARIDVASRVLTGEIEHDGLQGAVAGSSAAGPEKEATGGGSAERSPLGDGFLQDEVLDALDAAKLAVEARAVPAAPAAGEKH